MLARLISEPSREFHALDLAADGSTGAADGGDAGELLDEQARAEYKARLDRLEEGIEEARANGDIGRLERLQGEREFLAAELSRAVGLGGRGRRQGAAAERARVNVQRRLADAIRRIGREDAELSRILERAVRTGLYCVYDPI